MKKLLYLALSVFLLSGCATTIDLSRLHETKLDERVTSNELPSYIKEKKRPKVAVLPITDATQYSKTLSLGQTAQDSLTQLIVKSGGFEVTERAQLETFMEEMKFQSGVGAEIDADQFAKIATNIDTVFVGSITSATTGASFTEASSWKDKKGKTHNTPPSCMEEGKVEINIRAIASPSGSIINTFTVRARNAKSREVRYSSECIVQSPGGLLSATVNKAIDDAREDIANTFPAMGYIYKTMTDRSDQNKRYAFVNLGKNDGLLPGNKIDIVEFSVELDRVTKRERPVQRTICEGVVSESQLGIDNAILVIPEEAADRVMVGQAVKTKATVNIFRGIEKSFKNF